MTTDVLRLPGDYKIEAKNGNITLDVTQGTYTGTVTILGNLDIVGAGTQITLEDANIADNTITLNSGEVNDFVTAGYSGILIGRGNADDAARAASMLYYEENWNVNGEARPGNFKFFTAEIVGMTATQMAAAITANAIRIDNASTSTLNIFGDDNPLSVVNVRGTIDYELQVTDDDDIPNKKYVDDAVANDVVAAKKIQVGTSAFKAYSPTEISGEFYSATEKLEGSIGAGVVFKLESNQATLQGLTITTSTIAPLSATDDIVLAPSTGRLVRVNSSIRMTATNSVGLVAGTNELYYSDTAGAGGTGIYFVNTAASDELTSRRRSIIYGLIF